MRLKVAKRGLFLSKRLHGATMQLDLIAYAEQRRDHGIQRAARLGIIRRVGYAPAKSSNLAPKCTWVCA